MDRLGHLGWVAQRSYDVGGILFGVRTNSGGCDAWLAESLAAYEIDEELDPYFSLYLAEPGAVGRPFHILYRESHPVVKTHDLEVLGATFLGELEGLYCPQRDDGVYVDAAVVRLDGVSALVSSALLAYIHELGHGPVRRAGLVCSIGTSLGIDATGLVVPLTPALRIPSDAIEQLAELAPRNGGDDGTSFREPCRVDVVLAPGMPAEARIPLSPGMALYRTSSWVRNLTQSGVFALQAARSLVERARCYELRVATAKETLATIVGALAEPEGR